MSLGLLVAQVAALGEIAAKAVAFKEEALEPAFKTYQQQVVKNGAALAESLVERGLRIVSGCPESHSARPP